MAKSYISSIKLPNGETIYSIKDNGALQLTGGQVTGPVTFSDSISVDTINGVTVGNSPSFTDTHRPIKVNGEDFLGNNTTALDLIPGTNISMSKSGGAITINATDINTIYTLSGELSSNHKFTTTLTPSSGQATTSDITFVGEDITLTSDVASRIIKFKGPKTATESSTGITASTDATKTTLNTPKTASYVVSGTNGEAPNWTFEEKQIPNITSVGSASNWTFMEVPVVNSITGAVDGTDPTQLNITVGSTVVQSKSGGGNGTAPILGANIIVQSKSGGGNGSAATWRFENVSVPDVSVDSASVTITDPKHTHTLS